MALTPAVKSLRTYIVPSVTLAGFLSCLVVATASAQDHQAGSKEDPQDPPPQEVKELPRDIHQGMFSEDPEDLENVLPAIALREDMKNSVFSIPASDRFHATVNKAKDDLHEAIGLKFALDFSHVFQFLSEAPVNPDSTWGTASVLSFPVTWELVDRGGPTQGQVYFQLEGRWEYGTTGPQRLGGVGLNSVAGTANTYVAYVPTFLVRNLYWQQGTAESGWAYRIGKITPDQIMGSSAHLSPKTTFLPIVGTGGFSNGLPDSGLGIVAVAHAYNLLRFLVVISDANADRFNFGDIGAGDFYKAIELGVKVAPRTSKAGYSKVTLWHTDGTKDGQPANGAIGPEGWGLFAKYEMELADDGRPVVILRYGKSFNGAAVFREQVGVHFVLYDPTGVTRVQNDALGVAYNWVQLENPDARPESNIELFYRFPLFPQMDMTFSFQSIINPALDPDNGYAAVFGIRFRTTL